MRLCVIFFLFLALSYKSTAQNSNLRDTIYGKVVSISDGDTFTLLLARNAQEKIRLHGIDCPEKGQAFGQAAKQKLSSLIFNKRIGIIRKGKDRYGRSIALVFDVNKTCINEEMIKSGLAWHYIKYDQNPSWSNMEARARQLKLGLWSQPNAFPPWEWRKNK